MDLELYREYCQEFFTEDVAMSDQEIGEMPLADFYKWQQQLRIKYDKKRDIIKENINDRTSYQQYWVIYHEVFDKNFFNREIIKTRFGEFQRWAAAEQERKALQIEVDGVSYVAEYRFPVLWHEWESDGYAYVVKVDEQMKLVVTNHGSFYFDPKGVEFLQDRIAVYNKAVTDAQQALRSISGE